VEPDGPEVEFTIDEADTRSVAAVRPGSMRMPALEWVVHTLGLVAAMAVVGVALAGRRLHRLPVYLGVVAAIWGAAWAYVALFLFRRSPENKAWFEKLRRSPALTAGRCRVRLSADGGLTVVTPITTRALRPADLEDCVYSDGRFIVRTLAGQVVIIPERAFTSRDDFTDFIAKIRTRGHEEVPRGGADRP
jgi:hypothetical protein